MGVESAVAEATKRYFMNFSNDFGVKRAHAARTPQLLADLGQIKAEILPNTWEAFAWACRGCQLGGICTHFASAMPDRLNRSQSSIFHKSSECHFDSGLVEWTEEDYSLQASAIFLYFLP